MTKIQKMMLFSLLILTIILYILGNTKENKKPIIIEPIEIPQLIIEKKAITQSKPTNPLDILKKLKLASKKSQEKVELSKEIPVNKILDNLKKQTNTQVKIKEYTQKTITKIVAKNIEAKIQKVRIKVKVETIIQKPKNRLSREEEVALYKSQYSKQLELLSTSENFEIKEPVDNLPDSYYFKVPQIQNSTNPVTEPLNYVKKLGVVEVSKTYEVNFTIPD